jgi:protein AATF/BFR2
VANRYHVHEKLQNFMVPIPAGSWHEGQIDELFGSLFGRRGAPVAQKEEEEAVLRDDIGELRIFG